MGDYGKLMADAIVGLVIGAVIVTTVVCAVLGTIIVFVLKYFGVL